MAFIRVRPSCLRVAQQACPVGDTTAVCLECHAPGDLVHDVVDVCASLAGADGVHKADLGASGVGRSTR